MKKNISTFLIACLKFTTVFLHAMENDILNSLSSYDMKMKVERILQGAGSLKDQPLFYTYADIKKNHTCAGLLVQLASKKQTNDTDAIRLLELAGRYKSYSAVEISFWLPGGALLTDITTLNIFQDSVSTAIRENNIKNIAKELCNSRTKIFQEHLVLALALKKSEIAKLLVCLGADIDTPITDSSETFTVADFAHKQSLIELSDFIKQRMDTAITEPVCPFFVCCRSLLAKLL